MCQNLSTESFIWRLSPIVSLHAFFLLFFNILIVKKSERAPPLWMLLARHSLSKQGRTCKTFQWVENVTKKIWTYYLIHLNGLLLNNLPLCLICFGIKTLTTYILLGQVPPQFIMWVRHESKTDSGTTPSTWSKWVYM